MGRETVELDSGWRVNWTEYGTNLEAFALDDVAGAFDDASWFPARVPGDVHTDLMRAGRIPDPFVGMNTDSVLWMEHKDWWYRTRFSLPEGWAAGGGRRVLLLFRGLDCFATVYLNGETVGRHANMFAPLELDVTDGVREGTENLLAVRLASPVFAPLEEGHELPSHWGFPRQVSRKAQMSYGWDIAPRLVTVGIWRPVELACVDRARLTDVWIRTRELHGAEGATAASMEAVVTVEAMPGFEGGTLCVELDAGGGKLKGAVEAGGPGEHEIRFEWRLGDAELWWPNGSGEPYLHPYHVRLLAGADTLDERSGRFGVRTVELDRSPTQDGGHLFSFRVNGRELFVKGWNWTPPDAIFARATAGRRLRLLEAARDSGANMLRIWGGGVYEAPDFWDETDRLGLLVWQDFMFACARYPQHDAFLAEVRREAEHVVGELRSRPSLALWCGDNECDMAYATPSDAEGNRVNRGVLADTARALDPDRPYIPTSPHSPAARRYNDKDDSDVHLWKHGADFRDPFYLESRAKFVSEIGYLSLPDTGVIEGYLGGASAWPPEGEVWDHHSADTFRTGYYRGMRHVAEDLNSAGREMPGSLGEYVEITQELQAEACRTWIEHFASRPECGGILIWNLCDCWPQMSDAAIAYPFRPKKAYGAVTEAFRSIGRP